MCRFWLKYLNIFWIRIKATRGSHRECICAFIHWTRSTLVVVVLNLKSPRPPRLSDIWCPNSTATAFLLKFRRWSDTNSRKPAKRSARYDAGHACKIKDRAIALTRFRNYIDLYNICVWQLLRRHIISRSSILAWVYLCTCYFVALCLSTVVCSLA